MQRRAMQTAWALVCGLGLLAANGAALAAPLAGAWSQDRGHLESVLRDRGDGFYGAPRISSGPQGESVFGSQAVTRVKHGAFSLLIPGWSQWRSGHQKRALVFATAETMIWGGWIFSKIQADHREDQYVDFAQQFAQVQSTDHPDDYWRSLAGYRDSDDFNADVRADIRAGLEPESVLVPDSDAWRWQSEQRFQEFQRMRGDALSARDRADFIIVFALVNRVIAFVDAVRSGPPTVDADGLSRSAASQRKWSLDVEPRFADPSAKLSYRLAF